MILSDSIPEVIRQNFNHFEELANAASPLKNSQTLNSLLISPNRLEDQTSIKDSKVNPLLESRDLDLVQSELVDQKISAFEPEQEKVPDETKNDTLVSVENKQEQPTQESEPSSSKVVLDVEIQPESVNHSAIQKSSQAPQESQTAKEFSSVPKFQPTEYQSNQSIGSSKKKTLPVASNRSIKSSRKKGESVGENFEVKIDDEDESRQETRNFDSPAKTENISKLSKDYESDPQVQMLDVEPKDFESKNTDPSRKYHTQPLATVEEDQELNPGFSSVVQPE